MKAEFIKDVSENFNGTASLFRVPEFEVRGWDGEIRLKASYIVASAVHGWAYETYLFPADENGSVLDWAELDGSQKDTNDISAVMVEAGYEL